MALKGKAKVKNAFCHDCGMNTMPGRKPGTHEQFIVKDEVWATAGMPLGKIDPKTKALIGGGFLCVSCIEKRLGRRLQFEDFKPIAIAEIIGSCFTTERLRSRLLYRNDAEVDIAKIDEEQCPLPIVLALRRDMPDVKNVYLKGSNVYVVREDFAERYTASEGFLRAVALLKNGRPAEDIVGLDITLLPALLPIVHSP